MLARNLDYNPRLVERMGPAAVDDLLERGTLEDWVHLAAAVKADPAGPLAEIILKVVRAHRMYGTSALWEALISRARGESHGSRLAELRARRRLSQNSVARKLGISQSDVSKLEKRHDVRMSTLEAYVNATGGRLRLTAVYPDCAVEISLPAR